MLPFTPPAFVDIKKTKPVVQPESYTMSPSFLKTQSALIVRIGQLVGVDITEVEYSTVGAMPILHVKDPVDKATAQRLASVLADIFPTFGILDCDLRRWIIQVEKQKMNPSDEAP